MSEIGTFVLLFCVGGILIYGACKRVRVFDVFLEGAKENISCAVSVLPAFVGLLLAVQMLTASGVSDALTAALSPLLSKLGFPAEVLPLCILSPISGSGSLSAFQNLLTTYGADSFIGRTASVIAGSTETTFYTVTVYYGAVGVKKIRHTVLCALCADGISFLLSAVFVRLFFD